MVKAYQGKQLNPTFEGATLTGNLTIGANKIITTNMHLYDDGTFRFVNTAENAYKPIFVLDLNLTGDIYSYATAKSLVASNTDAHYFFFSARDTGVGPTEVARLQGAADPYFQATLPMVLNASGTPGTLVTGHFWFDQSTLLLKFYDGTAVKTVTSA